MFCHIYEFITIGRTDKQHKEMSKIFVVVSTAFRTANLLRLHTLSRQRHAANEPTYSYTLASVALYSLQHSKSSTCYPECHVPARVSS